ncbi:ribosomal protein S18 acetylase RimI-like enzyme [Pararhizobium capsulatum DSM 1112]|uniref:Ribosomal protein S18 acetylase RimI-like enzyme n=1 Tax=Pararhizobium capsulatum DSM 1112 TaxID=1121113 RepID=A0ABU0BMR7_9HYPH|nr:N-acetyltransferase [Pararhizobium capsulatum]MDQ0319534.1 ribosomal protein S18 acetylase RimI-like enzyme [Pararhizobium capsulatum DSM 1112]
MDETSFEMMPTIRMLSSTDTAAFRAIRLESLRQDPDAFASQEDDWLRISEADWQRHLIHNTVFAAFENETPVAVMGLMRQRAAKMTHRATIIMVYIRKANRGSGLASDMLDFLAAIIGIRQLELAVRADNAEAIAFYRKAGFAEIGRIPGGFLQDGREIDEILMARRTDRRQDQNN